MTAFERCAPKIGVVEFRDWYRSAEVFDVEQQRLFSNSWSIVAEESDLSGPGSYLTAVVAGVPIVVLRGDDGEIIAFENICRHRGIPVVSGSGRVGHHMTCPYHQWSYRRDGSLAVVPQHEVEFPDIDLSTLGLRPVAIGVWSGNVFVRPRATGPSLHESLAGLDERLADFVRPEMVQVAMVEFEAACNWKLIVENHVDVYHLWYLHQHSLRHLDHRSFAWEFLGDNWWSLEPYKDTSLAPTLLPFIPDRFRVGIGAHLLFPNVMVVTTGTHFATYEAQPITAERTKISLRIRSTREADAKELENEIREFLSEDVDACEQMQTATGSPSFTFGPLAQYHEEPVRRFHAALRERLMS